MSGWRDTIFFWRGTLTSLTHVPDDPDSGGTTWAGRYAVLWSHACMHGHTSQSSVQDGLVPQDVWLWLSSSDTNYRTFPNIEIDLAFVLACPFDRHTNVTNNRLHDMAGYTAHVHVLLITRASAIRGGIDFAVGSVSMTGLLHQSQMMTNSRRLSIRSGSRPRHLCQHSIA